MRSKHQGENHTSAFLPSRRNCWNGGVWETKERSHALGILVSLGHVSRERESLTSSPLPMMGTPIATMQVP